MVKNTSPSATGVIKKYYLPSFVLYFFLFGFRLIFIKSPNSAVTNFGILFGGAITISLMIGTFAYFLDTKWGPARREKLFSKSLFSRLRKDGFKREDNFLVATMLKYAVIVAYTWQGGKQALKVDVLFDIRYQGNFLDNPGLIKLEKRNRKSGFLWTKNSVGKLMYYNFSPPSYEKVVAVAESMIKILVHEGLRPIDYDSNKKLVGI